jgi:hypothetical protein
VAPRPALHRAAPRPPGLVVRVVARVAG